MTTLAAGAVGAAASRLRARTMKGLAIAAFTHPSNRDSERLLELVDRQRDWISLHTARLSRGADDASDVLVAHSVGRERRHAEILDEVAQQPGGLFCARGVFSGDDASHSVIP